MVTTKVNNPIYYEQRICYFRNQLRNAHKMAPISMKPSVSPKIPTMALASSVRLSSSILRYRLAAPLYPTRFSSLRTCRSSASCPHRPPVPGPTSAQSKRGSRTTPKRRTQARGRTGMEVCWSRTQVRTAKKESFVLSSTSRPLKRTWLCLSCSAAPCWMFATV
ncbi:hypothetical protein PRUPE_2G060100 [Prunus persica]|uniref:Uncharacterized protein n=1 Tax=Prunus persica TaxID=3760 RepID=A0A251QC35_PRUPE|nr:hypothetical protein PRUPE_2G060000 [Prunus persica]ONI21333.1 hypothetical protein PRUPE_2G060100 [Prunus persica]